MLFEDFMKVELRIGTIKSAEPVPKSSKLLKLSVCFGEKRMEEDFVPTQVDYLEGHTTPVEVRTYRTVVAGIGKTFKPEELINKQFLFVCNLPPAEIMGIKSEAMILASGIADKLILMTPTSQVESGSMLK
jgi:methionyl-tRNA synthetase